MVTIEQSINHPKQYSPYKTLLSAITTSDDTLTSTEEDDEHSRLHPRIESSDEEYDLDDEQDNTTIAICDCGRQLDSSWQCAHCRRVCSICNRALSLDPDEYCERCFRLCKYHGLYSISSGSVECPACSNNKN